MNIIYMFFKIYIHCTWARVGVFVLGFVGDVIVYMIVFQKLYKLNK